MPGGKHGSGRRAADSAIADRRSRAPRALDFDSVRITTWAEYGLICALHLARRAARGRSPGARSRRRSACRRLRRADPAAASPRGDRDAARAARAAATRWRAPPDEITVRDVIAASELATFDLHCVVASGRAKSAARRRTTAASARCGCCCSSGSTTCCESVRLERPALQESRGARARGTVGAGDCRRPRSRSPSCRADGAARMRLFRSLPRRPALCCGGARTFAALLMAEPDAGRRGVARERCDARRRGPRALGAALRCAARSGSSSRNATRSTTARRREVLRALLHRMQKDPQRRRRRCASWRSGSSTRGCGAYRDAFTLARPRHAGAAARAERCSRSPAAPIRGDDPVVQRGGEIVAAYLAEANDALRDSLRRGRASRGRLARRRIGALSERIARRRRRNAPRVREFEERPSARGGTRTPTGEATGF